MPWVKCCRLHAFCIYKVAINASSDELGASIASFLAVKEGNVASSPSTPRTKIESASRYFFSVCKVPNFAFQLHEVTFHLRFQRQSGSINRLVSTCKRGRRCLVALCATNKAKNCKQVVFFPCPKCSALPASCMKSRSICASSNVLAASVEPFLLAEEGEVSLSPFAP